jgi:hypothetical protein
MMGKIKVITVIYSNLTDKTQPYQAQEFGGLS